MKADKFCYIKESALLQYALYGVQNYIEFFKDNEQALTRCYQDRQWIEELTTELFKNTPKNCLYPNHTGACLIWCDCGCSNDKQCTNQ